MDHAAKQHHLTWEKTNNVGLLNAGDCGTGPSTAASCCITWAKAVRVHT